jgi:16S rRNA (cytosine967-C5)-methyltransferase
MSTVTSAAKRARPVVSPARLAAFEILSRVEDERAYASVLLASAHDNMRGDDMSGEDRRLCYELVMGTIRWQAWLDSLIEHYSRRKVESLDSPVRRAIRLGLYQLRFLPRIPTSAVVNESVNLTHRARLRSAGAFVNAVLRRATREPRFDPTASIDDPIEKTALETSHPVWLIRRWVEAIGLDETRKFALTNNQHPPIAFRLSNPGDDTAVQRLRAAGGVLTPSCIARDAWRIDGSGAMLRTLAREGSLYIQDEASQLVSLLVDPKPGERILDACAAPGGKTTHMAALSGGSAMIVAGDIHSHRLVTVRQFAERLRASGVSPVTLDAATGLPFRDGLFDRVLVDAPCSGTGTLRRNPEIRWRITKSDIEDLCKRQQRILTNSSQMVRSGGRLVYSTCSVEAEENEGVIAAFSESNPEFKPVGNQLPQELVTSIGALRTWPHRDGADGFFTVVFERQS